MANRDAEEIRLNYCKKCGDSLDGHDDDWCTKAKYPALEAEYEYLFTWAREYGIDLTKANENCADGSRHGAMEGDIMLDIAGCIDRYFVYTKNKEQELVHFVKDNLLNFDYSPEEVVKALMDLNNLEKKS